MPCRLAYSHTSRSLPPSQEPASPQSITCCTDSSVDGHAPFLLMLIRSARQRPGQHARRCSPTGPPFPGLARVPAPLACKCQAGRAVPSRPARLRRPRECLLKSWKRQEQRPRRAPPRAVQPGPPVNQPEGQRDPMGSLARTNPTGTGGRRGRALSSQPEATDSWRRPPRAQGAAWPAPLSVHKESHTTRARPPSHPRSP